MRALRTALQDHHAHSVYYRWTVHTDALSKYDTLGPEIAHVPSREVMPNLEVREDPEKLLVYHGISLAAESLV